MHMRPIRILGLSVAFGLAVAFTWPAQAEFKVRYPIVEFRELEIEHNGSVTFDKRNSGKNNSQSYPTEIEFGFLPWWKIGLETNIEAQPGQNIHYEATALENYFQLTPQGKYWADVAFFTEVERPSNRNSTEGVNAVTFGPLIQKEAPGLLFGLDTLHTINLLLEREGGTMPRPARRCASPGSRGPGCIRCSNRASSIMPMSATSPRRGSLPTSSTASVRSSPAFTRFHLTAS